MRINGVLFSLFTWGLVVFSTFAYLASTGHDKNATVVNVVAKYYDLVRTGDGPMTFLHCNGYKIENNCTHFNKKGGLKYENRYDLKIGVIDQN